MLGNPELERALLEQTYDGVMTVTGVSKQTVNGETVVTPDAVLHEDIPCALSFSIRPRSTVRLIWLFRQAAALRFSSTARPIG